MTNKETRSKLLERLTALQARLEGEDDADLAEIKAEIDQITEELAQLDEAVEAAEAAAEEDRADEDGNDEPEAAKEEEPAAEEAGEPEEHEDEERSSQAARRRELRSRAAAGETGRIIRTFEEETRNMETRSYAIDTIEYRNAWLKNLLGKPVTEEERTALANGSYVIPQETANKVWGKLELYPLLNAVDVMHIPGTVILPVEGTVNDANVVAMGTAATDSADTMAQVSLGVYKIIKTIEITADVAAMAIPAFETWLVDRLANKIFRKVTGLIAAGTGSSQPTGLTTITATNQTYTKAAITYTDVLTIISTLATEYLPNASFVMSKATFFANVLAIKDSNNNPIVVMDRQAPAKYNVLGFPVIIEDGVGTDIIFGDLKEGYVFNFGKDVEVARDESVGFRAGSTVFRGMCLGDGKPTGVGLVRFTKSAT